MTTADRFTLCLPGDPVAKGRPRVYHGHAITPRKTVNAEERLFAEFRRKYPNAKPLTGPVRIRAEFWMRRRGKPDIDNLLKTILDALNAVAYMDDAQVIELHAAKRMPDQRIRGVRGQYRNRKTGDPYTWQGREYEPHLYVEITELPAYGPDTPPTPTTR